MFDNVSIYMPTRGRVEKNLQITLRNLHPDLHKYITMVCHPGELQEHYENWGNSLKEIIEVDGKHIGEVRQKCIDMSKNDCVIFIDDSLNFHVRADSDTGNKTKYPLKSLTSINFNDNSILNYQLEMFKWVIGKIGLGYGMVGISRRSSNAFNLDKDEKENERVCSFWAINKEIFNLLPGNPKFSDMPLKEDFYIVLHFLTWGIPLITSYKFGYDRVGGSNSKGGCSIYRKLDLSNKSAEMLYNHFPDFVKIREKSVKSWNGEFEDKALDVTVYCKNAYEYGVKRLQGVN